MDNITPTMEDYLETIMLLEDHEGGARVTDIALKMGVAKSSVHMALHTLSDRALLVHEKYRPIALTERGREVATAVYARHTALIEFFEDILGVPPEAAARDACAVEHVVSELSMQKIIEFTRKHQE